MDESDANARLESIASDASLANATQQLISNFVKYLHYFISHSTLQEKLAALQKNACAVFIKPAPGTVSIGNTWYLKWQYHDDGTVSISVSHPT